MRNIIIIPARLESKRLNRKLLLPGPKGANDLPLLYFTWCQAKDSAADEVYIATDSSEIVREAAKFHATTIMTKKTHNCGTNRIAEAHDKIISQYPNAPKADCIINLQGDEPEIRGKDINLLIQQFEAWIEREKPTPPTTKHGASLLSDEELRDLGISPENPSQNVLPSWMKIATLAVPFYNFTQYSLPQNVKVVFDEDDSEAIYFSRGMIPWVNSGHQLRTRLEDNPIAYKHVGIYAYTPKMLTEFVSTEASRLERVEGLEQMRAIENQWPILVVPLLPPEDDKDNTWPLGVNTKHDYETWLSRIDKHD